MTRHRDLLVNCPARYDEPIFLAATEGGKIMATDLRPKQHKWEQRFDIVQYDTNDEGQAPGRLHLLGPVGDRCKRCLSRIDPSGDLQYTDQAEVELQQSGEAPRQKLIVPA